MTSDGDLVGRILDALVPLDVRAIPMFGKHGLYCEGKFVGIIGDGHLFIKYSDIDPSLLEGTEKAPPFSGAKDWHRVPDRLIDDPEWLRDAIHETGKVLPFPKPKSRGRRKW